MLLLGTFTPRSQRIYRRTKYTSVVAAINSVGCGSSSESFSSSSGAAITNEIWRCEYYK